MTELIIEPGTVERQYWKDLWNYRELFGMLAWRLHELNDGVCEFSILETGSPFAKYSGYDYGCVYPPKYQVDTLAD